MLGIKLAINKYVVYECKKNEQKSKIIRNVQL